MSADTVPSGSTAVEAVTGAGVTGPDPAESRRPRFHVTAEAGWVNDPHGLIWSGGQYHLFFQYVPGQTLWGSNCHWGHVAGPDLAHWTRRGVALIPQPDETGCWTGTVIRPDGTTPVAYYTSTREPDLGHGRVRTAVADDATLDTWTRPADSVLLDGPPPGSGVSAFRDPAIRQLPDGSWRMTMGGGLAGRGGVALQYSSPDARTWTYDGVICARDTADTEGTWTGTVWECPQLFALDDSWVLLFGVWDDDVLHYVAAAVGDYDGTTFAPRRWTRLTAGDSAYAATSFLDREGRRCLIHWLREAPGYDPAASGWAGALSVAQVLTLAADDRLVLVPHPDLVTLRRTRRDLTVGPLSAGDTRSVVVPAHSVDIDLHLDQPSSRTVVTVALVGDRQPLATLEIDLDSGDGRLHRPGHHPQPVPVHVGIDGARLRLLLDGDTLEVFTGTGFGAWRVTTSPGRLDISVTLTAGTLHGLELTAYEMAAGVD